MQCLDEIWQRGYDLVTDSAHLLVRDLLETFGQIELKTILVHRPSLNLSSAASALARSSMNFARLLGVLEMAKQHSLKCRHSAKRTRYVMDSSRSVSIRIHSESFRTTPHEGQRILIFLRLQLSARPRAETGKW